MASPPLQFFVLLAVSVSCYSLQAVLMAYFYRSFDPLGISGCRGLSLGISGLPLLLLVPSEAYSQVLPNLHLIVCAAFAGAIAMWLTATAVRYIHVGVNSAILGPVRVILLALFGYFYLGDSLSGGDLLCIVMILIALGAIWLPGISQHIAISNAPQFGIVLSMLCGVFMAITFMFFTMMSRRIDPLLSGYIWELSIGVAAFVLLPLSTFVRTEPIVLPGIAEFLKLLVAASPTVIATAAFASAVKIGPLPLAGALLAGSIFLTLLLGAIVHGERPPRRAVIAISVIVIGLFVLQSA